MRRFCSLSLLAVAVLSLLAGCGRRETPVDEGFRTHTLLLGNSSEPADLDPHLVNAYTDQIILVALFEGLTVLDEKTNQALPGVAERWDVTPDGLVYTFHLRSTARWSSGDPVTAQDFVYSFQRMLSPALAAEYAYMLYPIKNAEAFNTSKLTDFSAVGVTAVDDATLRITLVQPTAYLPALAAHNTWLPVHRATIEKFGKMDQRNTGWIRPGNLVGNGPFNLAEWTPNARLVVVKNPRYWDAAHTSLERIVFFPTEKPDVEERDFRSGQLHVTYDLPTSKIASYRDREPAKLRLDPLLQTTFFRFNTNQAPLNNPKVRRALSLAIDRAAISRSVLNGAHPAALSFVPPNCGGYTSTTQLPTDFATARRLLAEAGFPGGAGFPTLEVQVQNDELSPKVTEAIQAMWQRELGIHVTISPLEQKTWIQNQQTLNYRIALTGWVADFADPATFLNLFIKDGGNNWTGWASADYDPLIEEAAHTVDPIARFQLFQRAEAILLEDGPVAPVFFRARTYLINPAVRNWEPSPLGLHRFQLIRLTP